MGHWGMEEEVSDVVSAISHRGLMECCMNVPLLEQNRKTLEHFEEAKHAICIFEDTWL